MTGTAFRSFKRATNASSTTMVFDLVINILGSYRFQGFLVFVLIVLVYESTCGPKRYHGIPAVGINAQKGFFGGVAKAQEDWFLHGKEILDRGLKQVVSTFGDKGWSKKMLHDLKLMDSAMKESQRHHFGDIAAMHRIAEKPITLSDGARIPKGAFTMVSIDKMHDTELFKDPHNFKGSRFLKMREQPGQENRWQFATTSPEHLVFGHGKHACPGRFFAGNEIKVSLIYLLMKYDWKFTSEGRKEDVAFGQELDTDPTAKAMIKKRKLDIVL